MDFKFDWTANNYDDSVKSDLKAEKILYFENVKLVTAYIFHDFFFRCGFRNVICFEESPVQGTPSKMNRTCRTFKSIRQSCFLIEGLIFC